MKMMVNDKFPLNAALVKVAIICVSLGNVPSEVMVMFVSWIIDPLLTMNNAITKNDTILVCLKKASLDKIMYVTHTISLQTRSPTVTQSI